MLDEVLRENNLDNAKENEGCISAENFMQALGIVLPTVKEELKSGRVVVFDGCFYHEKVMDYLKKNLPSEGYIFTLKTSLEMCIERDKHREKTLGEMAARAVYGLVLPHEFGTVIDSSGTLEETHQEILRYLPCK
jgi:predicted kinase